MDSDWPKVTLASFYGLHVGLFRLKKVIMGDMIEVYKAMHGVEKLSMRKTENVQKGSNVGSSSMSKKMEGKGSGTWLPQASERTESERESF